MSINFKQMQNLFLQQSYEDSWEDFQRSKRKTLFPKWDYVILTASNQQQADIYQEQIKSRQKISFLPKTTKFIVIPDPKGKRVGSGGATLHVLKHIAEIEGTEGNETPFQKKILLIHSGGDSKRVPQYSVSGKLFAPVPRVLPNGKPSTIFDEFIISTAGIPRRMKHGMLVIGGDVILLFNPLQIDLQHQGATVISFPTSVSYGESHGVFITDSEEIVSRFAHKESKEVLLQLGAVNQNNQVNLDVGAAILDSNILESLYSLLLTNGEIDQAKVDAMINPTVCLSFYGDFLFPLSSQVTKEEYFQQSSETKITEELIHCRDKLWEVLSPFTMKCLSLSPSEYIHFGTTKELHDLLIHQLEHYSFLKWEKQILCNRPCAGNLAIYQSFIAKNCHISSNTYIENSYVLSGARVQEGAILSNVKIKDFDVPADTVLHGLKTQSGFVLRTYSIHENQKEQKNPTLFDVPLSKILETSGVTAEDIWETSEKNLWMANLYPCCETMEECLKFCQILYGMSNGTASAEEVEIWKRSHRLSLYSSFSKADPGAIIRWEQELQHEILASKFILSLRHKVYYKDALALLEPNGISSILYDKISTLVEAEDDFTFLRVYYVLSRYIKDKDVKIHELSYDQMENISYFHLKECICQEFKPPLSHDHLKNRKNEVVTDLPLRLNWGGGWTDAAPYCLEQGGVVLNAAIALRGKLPVKVKVQHLSQENIIFESDIGSRRIVIDKFEELSDCSDPFDSFALHKAALLATGIISPKNKGSLEDYLKEIGGGFSLSTFVDGVPFGSGLGTSSILAAACVKSLYSFFRVPHDENDIYQSVFVMEQLMTTGGGWQDQVGGLTPGIKFTTSQVGIPQKLDIRYVALSEKTKKELASRFLLVYTGQRRYAKNLLRDVVGHVLGNHETALTALDEMKPLAALMKFHLEQGDVTVFAKLLSKQWEICKQLDPGCTNTCIDQIHLSCADLLDGIFIAGAGGGGFLQMILKEDKTRTELEERLQNVFQKSGVEVWDFEFLW